jgi:hypothetical protein
VDALLEKSVRLDVILEKVRALLASAAQAWA